MEGITEIMKRKKVDKVKRNKEMLMIQLMFSATSRGLSIEEVAKEFEETKKKLGLAS